MPTKESLIAEIEECCPRDDCPTFSSSLERTQAVFSDRVGGRWLSFGGPVEFLQRWFAQKVGQGGCQIYTLATEAVLQWYDTNIVAVDNPELDNWLEESIESLGRRYLVFKMAEYGKALGCEDANDSSDDG